MSPSSRRLRKVRRLPAMLRRARVFEERLEFVRNEIRSADVTKTYTLRSTGLRACYRHHSADMGALADIFVTREYELPAPVAAFLAGLERPLVLDLGGHVGYFALFALGALERAEVVSFEPDPANADVLERCIELNRLSGRWQLRRAFADAAAGTVSFLAAASPGSHAVTDRTGRGVIDVEAVDVLPLIESFDFVKMDVEGAEWAILRDPRFAADAPPVLALEHHARGSRTADPGAEARELMLAAGYRVLGVVEKVEGMGTLWGLRADAAAMVSDGAT